MISRVNMDHMPEGVSTLIANEAERMEGGEMHSDMTIGEVRKGETVIGARIGDPSDSGETDGVCEEIKDEETYVDLGSFKGPKEEERYV